MNIYLQMMHKTVYPSSSPIPEDANHFELDEYFPLEHGGLNIAPGLYKNVIVSRFFSGKTAFRKFDFLRDHMNNIFMSKEIIDTVLDTFCKIQRKYFALLRFVEKCKYRKAKTQVEEDLYMNPLKEGDAGVFSVVQCGKKYLFSLANLIHYINVALSHAPNFFADPLPIKNPYNNLVFNKSTLYKIFFAIKSSTYLMPVLLYYFFMVDFNIDKFQSTFESQLRDIAIENYLKNIHTDYLHHGIIRMLKDFARKIRIDEAFPKERLVEIMRPYYRLYCIHVYAMDKYKKIQAGDELRLKLSRFYKHNPAFGRKIYKHERSLFGKKLLVNFNDQHPPFNQAVSIEHFMKNHSQYICESNHHVDIFGDDSDDESEASEHIVDAGHFDYDTSEEDEIIEGSEEEGEGEEDGEDEEIIIDSDDEESIAESSI